MSFESISSRLKERADKPSSERRPVSHDSFVVRARMIGVLLRDARLSARREIEDCAALLGIAPEEFEQWELGETTPTLPQLEVLAEFLDVPVSHFWGARTLQASERDFSAVQQDYLALRDRMVGALLRHSRLEAGLEVESLADQTGLSPDSVTAYELGEAPIPLHELTVLADAVHRNLDYFLERESHIGELLALREKWSHFASLPEDVQAFAANPLNIGFIEIAIMLSQMPTERLRRVGESVLNITM